MDFAEKTPMVKNTEVGVERAISQIFFQGGWWGVGNRKSLSLFRGCMFFIFFQGLVPFHSGGGWVCWKGLGGYDGGMFSGSSFVHLGVGS